MENLKRIAGSIKPVLKKHGGRIAYYGAVMIALSAIAFAAEQYRADRDEPADALILPAVEMKANAPVVQEAVFAVPQDAVFLRGYTREPKWNDALGQWENHMAVDYRCPDNRVESACAGVVRTVGKSGLYGGFIEIESDEYLLRYASIQPEEELKPGTEVSEGDLLGLADDSMAGEGYMGAHLHLELYRMNENIDFALEAEKNRPASD